MVKNLEKYFPKIVRYPSGCNGVSCSLQPLRLACYVLWQSPIWPTTACVYTPPFESDRLAQSLQTDPVTPLPLVSEDEKDTDRDYVIVYSH